MNQEGEISKFSFHPKKYNTPVPKMVKGPDLGSGAEIRLWVRVPPGVQMGMTWIWQQADMLCKHAESWLSLSIIHDYRTLDGEYTYALAA